MIAAHHAEKSARIGKSSLLDVLDPGTVYADRHFVFRFARNCTSMAADTLSVIDDEAVIHERKLLLTKLVRF